MRDGKLNSLAMAGILLLVISCTGCAPMVVSHRFHSNCAGPISVAEMQDGELAPCQCGSVIDHFFVFAGRHHPLLPGADPDGAGMGFGPTTIHPPVSRFHPVPTRPVFAPRDEFAVPHHAGSEVIVAPTPAEQPQPLPKPLKTAARDDGKFIRVTAID